VKESRQFEIHILLGYDKIQREQSYLQIKASVSFFSVYHFERNPPEARYSLRYVSNLHIVFTRGSTVKFVVLARTMNTQIVKQGLRMVNVRCRPLRLTGVIEKVTDNSAERQEEAIFLS